MYPTYTPEQAAHDRRRWRPHPRQTAFLDRALAERALRTTAPETIVCVKGRGEATLGWDELLAGGSDRFDLEAAASAVTPDDLLTLIDTSGTTGPPKGRRAGVRHVMATVAGATERLRFTPGMRAISWLPMAHIAERRCTNYIAITDGWQVTTCADPRAQRRTLALARPEVAATIDCEAVLEIVGSTSLGLQAIHAKRTTTDHPAREDAAPMFLANRYGLDARDTRASLGFAAMGAHVAAPPGSISTSIRSRHAAADRMRSRTCRTTFLEGG